MKSTHIAAGAALVVLGMIAATPAQASCTNICVRVYKACLAQGIETPAQCLAEENACFAECNGGARQRVGALALGGEARKEEDDACHWDSGRPHSQPLELPAAPVG